MKEGFEAITGQTPTSRGLYQCLLRILPSSPPQVLASHTVVLKNNPSNSFGLRREGGGDFGGISYSLVDVTKSNSLQAFCDNMANPVKLLV